LRVFHGFFSVVRPMRGYNSQRRGTAGTSQFFFLFNWYVCSVLCILCTVCVDMCTVLLPPGVNQIQLQFNNNNKAILAVWNSALTIYSVYLRLNLSTTPDL
jgi:ferredoxin